MRLGLTRNRQPVQTAWLLISTVALLVILAVERRYSNRIPFHYPLPRPVGNTTFAPTSERQIPPYVHYVFGLAPPSEVNQFNFIHYLCLTSAVVELKPEVLYFHYLYEPASWYWQRFKDELARSEMTRLEMVQERDVVEVFGNPVEHYAHKADVLRLEALQKYGGVYLDADVLVVRGGSQLALGWCLRDSREGTDADTLGLRAQILPRFIDSKR